MTQQQPQMSMPNNNYGGMNTQPQQQMQQPITPKQRPSGNGVHLKKGQKVNLAQQGQTLTNIKVCFAFITQGTIVTLQTSNRVL